MTSPSQVSCALLWLPLTRMNLRKGQTDIVVGLRWLDRSQNELFLAPKTRGRLWGHVFRPASEVMEISTSAPMVGARNQGRLWSPPCRAKLVWAPFPLASAPRPSSHPRHPLRPFSEPLLRASTPTLEPHPTSPKVDLFSSLFQFVDRLNS